MNPIIEVKNLSFTYPDGPAALKDINLSIQEGEAVGIIGPNGAGKSTLLFHLVGIISTRTGEIMIDGINLNGRNLKAIRQKVGFVFQDPDDQLFMPTVVDDLSFGLVNLGKTAEEISELIKEVLSEVNLVGFEERSSHHLSIGEKKRIALATVLVMKPRILVLDEPTANLDPRSRREFIHLIKKLPGTKVIAGHDLEMILELTGRVLLLNQGIKVAEGATSEILKDRPLMESNGLEVPLSLGDR